MNALILCDKRLPSTARTKLAKFGEVIELETSDITYAAISGHPDIFCCQVGAVLVVSPSLPDVFIDRLNAHGINWVTGKKQSGLSYPDSARYNAVFTENLLIHNLTITDFSILKLCGSRQQIHVKQGYTRCNLLPLPGKAFITSDKGIFKALTQEGFEVMYVNPTGIKLDGFPNGFIGGVCGVYGDNVFIAGSLSKFPDGEKIRAFLLSHSLNPVELYNGPLIDGGSILFI